MSRIAFLNAFAFLLILCNAATATTTKAMAKHKEPLANMLERNLYALDAAIAMASDESNLSNARSARNIKETAAETLTEEVNKATATTTTTLLSDAEVTQLIQMISFPTENVIKPKEQMAVEMEPRTAHGQTALAAVPVANDGTRHRRNVANDVSDDNEQHGYYVIAFENPNAAESGVPYSKLDIIPAAEQHRRQRRDKRANIATTTTTTADDGNNKLLQVPNDVKDNDDDDDDDDDGVDEDYNDDNDVDVDEDDDNVAATSARTFNMRQLNRYVRRLMRQLSRGTRQVKRKTKRVKHIDEELTVENFLKGLYATQLKQREKQKQSSSIAGWLGSWLT